MKVLLTGATGFLGRYVQAILTTHGIETVAIGRRVPDAAWAVDLLNLADIERVVERAGATHLLHLAWYVEGSDYWRSPLNLRWVESTLRLADAFCRQERLLALARTPGQVCFQTWMLGEFVRQTRGAEPMRWPGPDVTGHRHQSVS